MTCIDKIKLDWGGFALVEYLLSKNNFGKEFRVLDIGGAHGYHTKIMRDYGLLVDTIDKYDHSAEFHGDFNTFKFKKKYDMIFCSHVIEHQRNQGFFLDKIFDTLKDDGDLVISGPSHPAERFIEGHISSTILPLFLQALIYAGFDCKNGKMMVMGGIENSFIVKKAKNFDKNERSETGYRWNEKHKSRSPIELKPGFEIKPLILYLHNCKIWEVSKEFENSEEKKKDSFGNDLIGLRLNYPGNQMKKNINFSINHFWNFFLFDQENNIIKPNKDTSYVNLVI